MIRTPKRSNKQDDFVTPQMKLDLRKELQSAIQRRNNLTSRSKLKCIKFLENSFEDEEKNEPNDFDKRIILRRKAIEEVLTSERSYIAQLDKLVNFFVNPLKNLNLIDINSHTTLFGQLELIHNINNELLTRLENDSDDVAGAFLKLAPFFKIYSVYAFDYRNSLLLLQTLTTKNVAFRSFLEKAESRPEVQQKLNSLLITPIQRVPRYRLLLQQVLLYTSPADSDYKMIQESIRQIESSINHINSVVEDQENIQRMLNIQNSLSGRIPNIMRNVRLETFYNL
ncbi:CLUMA_CG021419, isoform A [Clunio marinus]|uniref:CLUMA_CG021419, isoform A n=1 Tax=Clunio marinus TaxID=568069 RepID=A0A1J1JC62_9DIPT|nr:CLUMA_CG021419, isoform A [Clunio marinus]